MHVMKEQILIISAGVGGLATLGRDVIQLICAADKKKLVAGEPSAATWKV